MKSLFRAALAVWVGAAACAHAGTPLKTICPRTTAQMARPTFFVIPIPFSDDLLTSVLGRPAEIEVHDDGSRPLTPAEVEANRVVGHRPDFRRMTPAETAAAFGPALRNELGEFGQKLKPLIAGKRFIDLGCGRPTISHIPRIVAQALGASEYIGVDLRNKAETRVDEFSTGSPFTTTFVHRDLSTYLSKEAPIGGNAFYVSGIEPRDNREEEGRQYIYRMKKKLKRDCIPGDVVIIGDASPNFQTIPGFTLVLTGGTQRVFVRDQ